MPSNVDEDLITAPSVVELVSLLSTAKARDVAGRVDNALVLGCDSLFEHRGISYGKPADREEAREFHRKLADQTATIHTGQCLIKVQNRAITGQFTTVDSTQVQFGTPTDDELEAYLDTAEPYSASGGITIEALGSWFITRINGEFGTVLGISLGKLRQMLTDAGACLTDYWPTDHSNAVFNPTIEHSVADIPHGDELSLS